MNEVFVEQSLALPGSAKHHENHKKIKEAARPSCRQLVEAALDTDWGWQTPYELLCVNWALGRDGNNSFFNPDTFFFFYFTLYFGRFGVASFVGLAFPNIHGISCGVVISCGNTCLGTV